METRTKKQLLLNKGQEKFVFRFYPGEEDHLLDALVAQAEDPRTSFDWFDAAVLSFKLTTSLINQADSLIASSCPGSPGGSRRQA
jgi:hypothetical protein